VDASTGSATEEGGLGAILTQFDQEGKFHVISYGSNWNLGHGILCQILRGKRFILYTDHKPLENLGHFHNKTLNRLQIAMNEFDFETCQLTTCPDTPLQLSMNLHLWWTHSHQISRSCKQRTQTW
jgi:hypothetical protein